MKKVSVVIPTFNGKELLSKNLPSVMAAVNLDEGHEIIIIDDASDDGTVDYIKKKYPKVNIQNSVKNQGFARSCNFGVELASNSIVVLLNNDVRVSDFFLTPLIASFGNADVFAVGAKVFFGDSEEIYVGKTEFRFVRGVMEVISPKQVDQTKRSYSIYAGGGMAAFSREKFLALGGFSEIYAPFYWEDADLCYRAWRRGWKTIYNPDSKMYHEHQGTIGEYYDQEYIEAIRQRNSILFVWRNISDRFMLITHFAWLPLVIMFSLLRGRMMFVKLMLLSSGKILAIRKMLKAENTYHKLSDREVVAFQKEEMI